jgi:SAM-dependent methyltransferase|tara:strand:+ start:2268 stop:2996 length:729 start_codon:yes stop_codon:yes gene_type:complete
MSYDNNQEASSINNLYNHRVRLPQSYFKKYEKVPEFPGKKDSGGWNRRDGWKGHDFPRVWCILDFIEWIEEYNAHTSLGGHIGFTCPDDPELEFVEGYFEKKSLIQYPKFNLHNEIEVPEKFDFFLFSQTLEHLYNTQLAIKNIKNAMNQNGLVFTSVPTINIPHMTPVHFGGLTPMGLAALFAINGFEVLKIGQWGNHDYICKMFGNHRWPDFYELSNENGEVSNEERNCCQCWILARALT